MRHEPRPELVEKMSTVLFGVQIANIQFEAIKRSETLQEAIKNAEFGQVAVQSAKQTGRQVMIALDDYSDVEEN
ncbi:MAG: hypothetical protein RIS70_2501 [Planctomycetota bacterium]